MYRGEFIGATIKLPGRCYSDLEGVACLALAQRLVEQY
jgi:hypothetical protein